MKKLSSSETQAISNLVIAEYRKNLVKKLNPKIKKDKDIKKYLQLEKEQHKIAVQANKLRRKLDSRYNNNLRFEGSRVTVCTYAYPRLKGLGLHDQITIAIMKSNGRLDTKFIKSIAAKFN